MNIEEILTGIVNTCVSLAWKLIGALVVLLIGNLIIRFILRHLKNGKTAGKMDPMLHTFVYSVTKIGAYLVLTVIIVAILGIETASIVTVIASAGAAIALGLQGSLSHLAGGVMLLIFRPFRIGDFIEVCGYAGTVSEVGIFYTELTTVDNCVYRVPNGALISSSILNYSVKDTRRVDLAFDVAPDTDIAAAERVIMDVVRRNGQILPEPDAFLRMTEVNAASRKLTLRVWTKSEHYWGVKFDLTEALHAAFAENGICLFRPQMDVHVKND